MGGLRLLALSAAHPPRIPLAPRDAQQLEGYNSNESSSTHWGGRSCSGLVCSPKQSQKASEQQQHGGKTLNSFLTSSDEIPTQALRSFGQVIIHRVWRRVTKIILQAKKKKKKTAKMQKCPFAEYFFRGTQFYIMTQYCKGAFCFMCVHKWLYFREIHSEA